MRGDDDLNGGRPVDNGNGNGEMAAEDEDQFLAELRTAMTDDEGQPADEHAPWLPSAGPTPPPPPAPPVETDAERWRFDRGR
jgi:hypothetical protein